MKKIFFGIIAISALFFQSCDKVSNPYPKQFIDIDTTLLYGMDLVEYKNTKWPTFSENTNTLVNVLIEDFTGHRCIYCPAATTLAEDFEALHPGRVFIAGIHASPSGGTSGTQQDFDFAPYTQNFTNPTGLQIAVDLAAIDANFSSNPAGTTNRKTIAGHMFNPSTDWATNSNNILNANVLKVNLQSKTNYFPETRGMILHTEVDLTSTPSADLFQVVYLMEDSLISPQKFPLGAEDLNYVHRDIMRGCIDGLPMGRKLTELMKVDKNGAVIAGDKYYLNYSYKLPAQFNAEIMHLLIYVYDSSTMEILQVIRQKVKE